MNQDSSTTISTEYGDMKVDDITSTIKEKFNLDEARGRYRGYHLSNRPGSDNYFISEGISQKDIMSTILQGTDTFCILPTGGGKSVCYQGSAMFFPGVTFIISPLVALIQDQVDGFNKRKINIANNEIRAIAPKVNSSSITDFFDKLSISNTDGFLYKLAYISPEKFSDPKFRRELSAREANGDITISFIVVDEAHCLSQMSLDFRESYLFLYEFIRQRPVRPTVAAFTATANWIDRTVIERILGFTDNKQYDMFESLKKRTDLYFKPFPELMRRNMVKNIANRDVRFESLLNILKSENYMRKSTVVFCTTIEQVNVLYDRLSVALGDDRNRVHRYNGSMTRPKRKRNLKSFSENRGQVIICTKSMGMGIDIKGINLIIHYDISLSLEDYYQEIGRGARGGEHFQATCYMLYEKGSKKHPQRGSIRFTERWIQGTLTYKYLQSFFVASRLSLESQKLIINMALERFELMKIFAQEELGTLTGVSQQPLGFLWAHFLHGDVNKKSEKINSLLDNLEAVLKDVYEFHIGNNYIINMLRWHPESYELGTEQCIHLEEWYRKQPKNKIYNTLIKTDIAVDSAFVVIKGLKEPDEIERDRVLTLLNNAWNSSKKTSHHTEHLYLIADSSELTILAIFVRVNGKWKFEDGMLQSTLIDETRTNVKGLLPESRYPKWHEYISGAVSDSNSIVGPFIIVRGKRQQNVTFKLDGNTKPTYFDLCVSDAIYSLHYKGFARIYIKNIWEVLSGDPDIRFSRAKSNIEKAITGSIKVLSNLKVSITDTEHGIMINNEPLLSIHKSRSKPGYVLDKTPPLYRYSEEINGELIRVPVSLFALHLHQYQRLKPYGITFGLLQMPDTKEIKLGIESGFPAILKSSFSLKCNKYDIQDWTTGKRKTLRLSERGAFSIKLLPAPGAEPELLCAKMKPWQANAENSAIAHLLIHRISIFRGSRRCSYLSFDTMLNVLKDTITKDVARNREHFIRKTLAILSYYRQIEYVDFIAYSNNTAVLSRHGIDRSETRTVEFKVTYGTYVTIWRSRDKNSKDTGYIKFHDIRISQINQRDDEDGNVMTKSEYWEISELTGVKFLSK